MANNRKIMEQLIKKSNKFLPLSAFSLLRRSHLFFSVHFCFHDFQMFSYYVLQHRLSLDELSGRFLGVL